jgi:hypothetical protein
MPETARPGPGERAGPAARPAHAAGPSQLADRHLGAVVTAVSLLVGVVAARLRLVNTEFSGDEPHYLLFNVALQKHHSLDVIPVYQNREYASFYHGVLEPHVVTAPGGPAALHGFGGPLLWHVPYLLAGPWGAVLFVAVVSALTVLNIFLFLRERGITRHYATLVALLFALGSPLFVYSSMLFVEPIAALATIYAVRVALDPRRIAARPISTRRARARLVVASAAVAYLPWVHGRFLLLTLPLLALLAWRVHRMVGRRPGWLVLCWAVPAALLVVGYLSYNAVVWHSLNPAPANAARGEGLFETPVLDGFAGLTLDRTYGLVPNFPIFVMVIPGVVLALRRASRGVNLALGLVIAPTLLALSTYGQWWAGHSAPARFLVAIAPLFSYYVAVFLQRLHHWLADTVAITLALAAFLLGLVGDLVSGLKFHSSPGANEAMRYLSERCGVSPRWQLLLPSLGSTGDRALLEYWLLGLVGGGIAVGLLVAARQRTKARSARGRASPDRGHAEAVQ